MKIFFQVKRKLLKEAKRLFEYLYQITIILNSSRLQISLSVKWGSKSSCLFPTTQKVNFTEFANIKF